VNIFTVVYNLFKYILGREHLENLGNDNSVLLKQVLKKQSDRVWSGLIRLRVETSGGPLWIQK
jgi:hypothetical protein